MRKKFFYIVIPGIVVGIIFVVIVTAISKSKAPAASAELLQPVKSNQLTAADKQIQTAQSMVQAQPDEPRGYNMLAAAFMLKSRETGDFSLNARAEESIKQSFKIAPDNFDGMKMQANMLLNYHRFAEALDVTKRAQAINSRDHEILGATVDSYVELGDYDKAVEAAQKMVDLRPDTASYSRISYLRSLHGDSKGAIEMMKMAAESAGASAESAAWCRVHLGDELINTGKLKEAETEYDHALYNFPDYHLALAAKGRARYAAGDLTAAADFFKKAAERVPLPDYIAALGDIYAKQGKTDEAKQQYDQVEFIEKNGPANTTYSRQLAIFWADHDLHLDEALAAAQAERNIRQDIYTSDALAWCQYKKGQLTEAQNSMNEALKLGSRDPKLLYHAGMIAAANNDNKKAVQFLTDALALNPSFDILQADVAKEKLKSLKNT